jgi:thymidylate synthase ThyX
MTISAKVLADSVHTLGARPMRITTLEWRFNRWLLPETATHRVLSRNTASSRAIPVQRMLDDVMRDPAHFTFWGCNQRGMQAEVELDPSARAAAEREWLEARDDAVRHARNLLAIGAHKQEVNRVLEPYAHVSMIVTATDWANFHHLRRGPQAQPEIKVLADLTFAAQRASTPVDRTRLKGIDRWHLPMIGDDERHTLGTAALKVCAARCARVSYLTHDGRRDFTADIVLHDQLTTDGHWSPLEHAALPFRQPWWKRWMGHEDRVGNLSGWSSYRKQFANEHPYTPGQVEP